MKAGSTLGQSPLTLDLSSVTVFVGPNNSGKSRALQEIENWARSTNPAPGLVVDIVEFEPWTEEEIEKAVHAVEIERGINEVVAPEHILIGKLNPQSNAPQRIQIHKPSLIQEA